jgi:hypothetical protein
VGGDHTQTIAHDRARWNLRVTTIDAKLDGHKERWKKLCAPTRPSGARRSAGGIITPSS